MAKKIVINKKSKNVKTTRKMALDRVARVLKKNAYKIPALSSLTMNSTEQLNSIYGVQRGSTVGRNYFTSDYNIYGGAVTRLARYMDYEIMDREHPIIQSALDIYEAAVCLKDRNGDYLKIYSPNTKIKNALQDLFYGVMNLDFTMPQIARSTCKYGDHFAVLTLEEKKGITGFYQVPAPEMDKEEAFVDNRMKLFWKWIGDQSRRYEIYEVAHFRITDIGLLPFGRSILDGARRPWKQLKMLEDGMMIYQISRSPETRAYYVDVGAIEPEQVGQYLTEFADRVKRSTMIGKDGTIDLRYNPMSINEDIIIPVRADRQSARIETLPGIQGYPMDPIDYVQRNLFASLKVPKAYLGYDDEIRTKATLLQEDSRFSKIIQHIQDFLISEFNKLALTHLALRGFKEDELNQFELSMVNPSAAEEQIRIENLNTIMGLVTSARDAGAMSMKQIQTDILHMSPFEIATSYADRIKEAEYEFIITKIKEGGKKSVQASQQSPIDIDKNTIRRLAFSELPGEGTEPGGAEAGGDMGLGGGGGMEGGFDLGGGDEGGGEDIDLGGGEEGGAEESGDAFDRIYTPDEIVDRSFSGKKKKNYLESTFSNKILQNKELINGLLEKFGK